MTPSINPRGKHIHFKLFGVAQPASAVLKEWEDAGIWIEDQTFHADLALLTNQKGIPGFLGRNPFVFLPFHRIEWLMLAEKDSHSHPEATQL